MSVFSHVQGCCERVHIWHVLHVFQAQSVPTAQDQGQARDRPHDHDHGMYVSAPVNHTALSHQLMT